MSDKKNGLYYESVGIRNQVLSRNIGEYSGYNRSFLINGGLAVGMPYAFETELTPYSLSERAAEGIHINLSRTKEYNPKISIAFRQGGLFGYTHEVINPYADWLSRNRNLIDSYFDYNSTEDIQWRLDRFPNALPWGQGDVTADVESGGLRAYSKHSDPQNSEYFNDYTEYARSIFTGGLSFDKHLGERYITGLLYGEDEARLRDIGGDAQKFIEEKAGYITNDIEALKSIDDTELGYIGKIMTGDAKSRQILAETDREKNNSYFSITPIAKKLYGLDGADGKDEFLSQDFASISYNDKRLRVNIPGILEYNYWDIFDNLEDGSGSLDENYKSLRFLADNLKRGKEEQRFYYTGKNRILDKNATYAEYYNTEDNFKEFHGDSIDGYFSDAGVYDYNVEKNEHFDEQDKSNAGERDILSSKISYNETEKLGLDNQNGFSSADNSLLERTKKLFEIHKIKTLIGRFHTSSDNSGATSVSLTQSATNPTYGISHGRNLLKLNPTRENGYDNPYCRVWTYHHQYSQMTDLIRPFSEGGKFMSIDGIQAEYPGRPILRNGGQGSWADKTVLNRNGMVNIAPTRKIGDDELKRVTAKQCMFSIENLAWKNINPTEKSIDAGEIGPLGGRIMWFPPYNITFNESVSVSWGANDFIGRGEKIYSYNNTERSGTLSFTILADHPSILDYWLNTNNRRTHEGIEKENDQQTVLRFFAGCNNLDAIQEPPENVSGVNKNVNGSGIGENSGNTPKNGQDETSNTPEDNINENIVPGPAEFSNENSIAFYVFFPNNFSGIDFADDPKVAVNYLVNGKNGFKFDPDDIGNISPGETVTRTKNGDNVIMAFGGDGYEMADGKGLTDSSTKSEIKKYNSDKEHDNARDYLWGYGIDTYTASQDENIRKKYPFMRQERLTAGTSKVRTENYCDSTNKHLNSTPNSKADKACGYSFIDVAVALTTDYKYSGKGENENRVKKIKEILGLEGSETNNIKGRKYYFAIAGGASVHGVLDRNVGLSNRRATFLRSWLEDCFKKLNLKIDYAENSKIATTTGIAGGNESKDVNSESAKRGRYAKAVIYWNDEDVIDATDSIPSEQPESGTTENTALIKDQMIKDEETANITNDEAAQSPSLLNTTTLSDFSSTRYRDEEKFFSLLEENSPIVYKNIVDKVKYFDPVYHSITPEGFNRRLAFLHQCTRQGPTVSSSDLSQTNGFKGAGYAGNLSFGRPPVCVLRLGDFFNTRIIINSLNIQYEQPQWDLNPEGIGVQPMLANVTIGFVFQGGSSLGGPIQRLQNAVSFNYYANQEVYDDRADVAVYKDKEFSSMVWIPGYGNVNVGSVNSASDAMKTIKKEDKSPNDSPATTAAKDIAKSTASSKKKIQDILRKSAKELIENLTV